MKKFDNWWLPECEEHLQEWMSKVGKRLNGRLAYQGGKYEDCKKFIKNYRHAVDIGSHVGLLAYNFSHDFQAVTCFEPTPEHIDCWKMNMWGRDNATLYEVALGKEDGSVSLGRRTGNSSGDTQIVGSGNIPMKTLDSYNLENIDFIKIDCEGYELNILEGAKETIMRCKPCIMVEQKGDMAQRFGLPKLGAVDFLQSLGATLKMEISGDYILAWD